MRFNTILNDLLPNERLPTLLLIQHFWQFIELNFFSFLPNCFSAGIITLTTNALKRGSFSLPHSLSHCATKAQGDGACERGISATRIPCRLSHSDSAYHRGAVQLSRTVSVDCVVIWQRRARFALLGGQRILEFGNCASVN